MRWAMVYMLSCVGCALISCHSEAVLADEPESIQSLQKEKLTAAEEWWHSLAANMGPVFDFAKLFPAALALRDAQIDLATNKPERIKVLTEYRDRIQQVYNHIDALAQVNALGGEAEKRAEARFLLLEAKLALKKEEAMPDNANPRSR